MIKVDISGDIRKDLNIANMIKVSSREIALEIRNSIYKEFKNTDKMGRKNSRNQYARRRSLSGQSLAKDTGNSLSLVDSALVSSSIYEVGIKTNTNDDRGDYAAAWEVKGRPTVKIAGEASYGAIDGIFNKNFKPK